jgi:hypothetical protein
MSNLAVLELTYCARTRDAGAMTWDFFLSSGNKGILIILVIQIRKEFIIQNGKVSIVYTLKMTTKCHAF